MGDRGPGARPRVTKSTKLNSQRQRLAWQKPGLTRIERVVKFIESLPVTSGKLAGTKFKLRPWQREIIDGIYRADSKGRRIVREALLTVPRKNGKTALAACLALCHFIGPESESRGELFSAAAKRKQAAKIFEEMKAIILRVPWMAERVNIRDFSKDMEDMVTGSKYWALAAEASTEHGGNTSFWIYDELAQAKNRELYDVLKSSTGARSEPLGIVISTQSHDPKHVMSELVDYGIQIRDGLIENPAFYAVIYSAPKEADPWSETTWAACNPALGDFRSLEDMQDAARRAQQIPAEEAPFRLLFLNQRSRAKAGFIPPPVWDACGEDEAAFDLDSLRGRSCYGAIDLSGSGQNDLTALVLIFRIGETLKALPFFWAAEDGLDEAGKRDRASYRLWATQGHLLTTPGKILDYGWIAQKLAELTSEYDLKILAVDPWRHKVLIKELEDIGVDLVMQKHGQGIADMSPPVNELENVALSGKLRHNQNPILTWCMDNIEIVMDSAGNRKFDKSKATGRIDGAVALAMAVGLSQSFATESQGIVVTVI